MPPAVWLVVSAALVTAEPVFDAAELAELVTLVRPSDALDEASAAFSFTAPAASDVVEALRMPARRTVKVDCRSTARDAAKDIVRAMGEGWRRCRAGRAELGPGLSEKSSPPLPRARALELSGSTRPSTSTPHIRLVATRTEMIDCIMWLSQRYRRLSPCRTKVSTAFPIPDIFT